LDVDLIIEHLEELKKDFEIDDEEDIMIGRYDIIIKYLTPYKDFKIWM